MKKSVLGVILCRSNSSRLKDKLKLRIEKKDTFTIFVDRLKKCKQINKLVISTTKNKEDDYFKMFAIKNNMPYYRGSEKNVWHRFSSSIKSLNQKFDIAVRCNSDNPLIMPTIIDEDIINFKKKNYDFFSPFYKNQIPFGYALTIFKSKNILEISKKNLSKKYREHIDNYFIENLERFKVLDKYNPKYFCPNLFLTLDTKFDYNRIKFYYKKIKNIGFKKQPEKLISIFKNL